MSDFHLKQPYAAPESEVLVVTMVASIADVLSEYQIDNATEVEYDDL